MVSIRLGHRVKPGGCASRIKFFRTLRFFYIYLLEPKLGDLCKMKNPNAQWQDGQVQCQDIWLRGRAEILIRKTSSESNSVAVVVVGMVMVTTQH